MAAKSYYELPDTEKRMRYLGVLSLLSEASPYVTEEIRDQIEAAFADACADGSLRMRRILNRWEIEPVA